MRLTEKARWLIILATMTLSAGCASSEDVLPSHSKPEYVASEVQVQAMSDGIVTKSEYEAGYRRYVACLAEAGFEVAYESWEYDVFNVSVPKEAVTSGVDDRCYETEYRNIDESWQLAHEDTSLDAELLKKCLEENDLPVPEKYVDREAKIHEHKIDISTCGE